MKLQAQVMLIMLLSWLIISAVIFADYKFVIVNHYKELETQIIDHEIEDTQNAFNQMLNTLALYGKAFSQWDDAYAFMQHKDQRFIDTNFVAGTFTTSKINFLMYYDLAGQLYFGKAFDNNTNKIIPVPDTLKSLIEKNINILTHQTTIDRTGIINTSLGLIVMTFQSVLTSNASGPSRGILLIGYYLTDNNFTALGKVVGLNLQFYPLATLQNNLEIKDEYQQLQTAKLDHSQSLINDKLARGYILLTDINKNPVGILQIDIPRNVYQQGISTSRHYLFIVIILGLIVMVLTWQLLERFVLSRVLSISKQVSRISYNNHFDNPIALEGNDELGDMVKNINNMMKIISDSQARLRYLATHDSLTRLPNRLYFYTLLKQEIEKAKLQKTKIAVMFIDIDKFKKVNDQYGHDVGDKVIQAVAKRIKNIIRSTDMLGHQSGDEFIVYLSNFTNEEYITDTANRIISAGYEPFKINNHIIKISFSLGISIFPTDGTTADELINKADHVMYKIKALSGNNFEFYNTESKIT